MGVDSMQKPRFNKDQMVSSTQASKRFSEVRKKAKSEPIFILDHNEVDSIILSYDEFEQMHDELITLRETVQDYQTAERLREAEANNDQSISLIEGLSEERYNRIQNMNRKTVLDEDLFE